MNESDSLGRFAQGEDAAEATADMGKDIMEKSLAFLGHIISEIPQNTDMPRKMMNYEAVENLYKQLLDCKAEWCTLRRWETQISAPIDSQWKEYEREDI